MTAVATCLKDLLPKVSRSHRVGESCGGPLSSSRVFADRVADPASDAVLSMDSSLDGLSTSGGLRWTSPNQPTTTLEGRISTGVRLPNLADFTRFDVARSGEVEIPAFGLDPEEFLGVEASIREQRDSWSWLFTAYFTAIDGMIIRRPTGDVIDGGTAVTKKNAGDGRIYGIEGSLLGLPRESDGHPVQCTTR